MTQQHPACHYKPPTCAYGECSLSAWQVQSLQPVATESHAGRLGCYLKAAKSPEDPRTDVSYPLDHCQGPWPDHLATCALCLHAGWIRWTRTAWIWWVCEWQSVYEWKQFGKIPPSQLQSLMVQLSMLLLQSCNNSCRVSITESTPWMLRKEVSLILLFIFRWYSWVRYLFIIKGVQ